MGQGKIVEGGEICSVLKKRCRIDLGGRILLGGTMLKLMCSGGVGEFRGGIFVVDERHVEIRPGKEIKL